MVAGLWWLWISLILIGRPCTFRNSKKLDNENIGVYLWWIDDDDDYDDDCWHMVTGTNERAMSTAKPPTAQLPKPCHSPWILYTAFYWLHFNDIYCIAFSILLISDVLNFVCFILLIFQMILHWCLFLERSTPINSAQLPKPCHSYCTLHTTFYWLYFTDFTALWLEHTAHCTSLIQIALPQLFSCDCIVGECIEWHCIVVGHHWVTLHCKSMDWVTADREANHLIMGWHWTQLPSSTAFCCTYIYPFHSYGL